MIEQQDAQGNPVRVYVPFAFKTLKQLKTACAQYGPNAPFTQALLDSLAMDALPPNDWKQLARACLTEREYLLWNSDFATFCQNTAEINHQQGIPITFDMLGMAGEGPYRDLSNQLNFNPAAYAQTNAAAVKAWRKISMPGKRAEELTKIVKALMNLFEISFLDYCRHLVEY